ncbi:MAG: hypothetical protein HZB75_00185 [Candidatus Saccharibacteria bacterium]|nr:MAG: hypothetical protein HZB75_00185 [Candidatus Saccharibacteria bacterium]
MVKSSSRQIGSVHFIIIIILVVTLLGVLGFVFWQNFINKKDTVNTETNKTIDTAQNEDKSKSDMLTYRNDSIGIEFNYPKNWIKIECDNTNIENPQNKVYFGTTNDGLSIVDGKSTQLCEVGSDFPPQMTFSISDDIDDGLYLDYAQSATDVMIDGIRAKKYLSFTDSKSIMPGLESTTYVIKNAYGLYITANYKRFPRTTSGSRDNSEASLRAFVDVVERSLRFLRM